MEQARGSAKRLAGPGSRKARHVIGISCLDVAGICMYVYTADNRHWHDLGADGGKTDAPARLYGFGAYACNTRRY